MGFFEDPIIIAFVFLAAVFGLVALRPRRRPDVWLMLLTVLLFALPRAGILLTQLNLPLPVAYPVVAVFIAEWLMLRRSRQGERSKIGYFFLLYAAMAGVGLTIGLSTGGNHLTAFLELCFYLFSILLFFYTSETFQEPRQFLLFARMVLILSVAVSAYGIAQGFFGGGILVDSVTYNSGSDVARSYLQGSSPGSWRVLSSYGDPNVLASQLIVFVGIALALVVGKGVPWHIRLGCLVVLGANTACMLYTGSRAGAACLLVVGLVVLCWRTRWALLLLPVLAAGLWMLGPQLLEASLGGRYQVITATDIRRQFPEMFWQLLQSVPFGCGLGNAVALSWEGSGWLFATGPTNTIWGGLNSFWLNLLSRLGVAGVIAFALLIGFLFRYVWRHAKQIGDSQVRAFLAGGLAGFVGQWLIWLVNNTYMLPGGGLNFWFTMGMLVAGCRAFAAPAYGQLLPAPAVWTNEELAPA